MTAQAKNRLVHLGLLVSVNVALPYLMLSVSAVFDRVMPFNDVLLYGWWLQLIQQGEPIFGLAQPFVYPYVSLLPMWLAQLLGGPAGILVGWCSLLAILNSVATGFLISWGRGSNRSFVAAWFWVAYLALLGPSGLGRIDAIAAGLAVIGVVAFSKGRNFAAASLFTFGAWIKIWPFALAIAAFISSARKRILASACSAVISSVLLFAFFAGANANVFSFVFTQGDRGIQIESPIATVWLWLAKFGVGNAGIYYDKEIITNQISGDLVDLVAKLMTPLMFGALLITAWLGYRAFKVGVNRHVLFATISLTAVLDLIVFNKVGSPQFMSWLAVPAIAWIFLELKITWFPAVALGLIALLTNLVYPVFYLDLMGLGDVSVVLLTARNALLIAMLIWANLQLSRLSRSLTV